MKQIIFNLFFQTEDRCLMYSPSHLGLNEKTEKYIIAKINPDPMPAYLIYGKLLMQNVSLYKP